MSVDITCKQCSHTRTIAGIQMGFLLYGSGEIQGNYLVDPVLPEPLSEAIKADGFGPNLKTALLAVELIYC